MHRMGLVLSLLACSFESAEAAGLVSGIVSSSATTTFTSSKKGFTFEYPADWVKNESIKGFDIFIMAPRNPEGNSFANLSVISGKIPPNTDLNIFSEENIKSLTKDNTVVHILNSGKTTIAGLPAIWTHYKRDDDQTEITHYFFISNGIGYLITCGTVIGYYDQYKATFEKMIKSFAMHDDDPQLKGKNEG